MTEEQARRLAPLLDQPPLPARAPKRGLIDAAVLVPLYVADGELQVVLTRRRHDLRRHAGQIAFPGGRHDADDATLRDTALREAHEEIGLDPAAVELLGSLHSIPTVVTGFQVHPFVALIRRPPDWTPAAREVAAVIELPLSTIAAGSERRVLWRRGLPFRTRCFIVDEHLIWGATARIVSDLLARTTKLAAV